ncbi:MAG TPA: hypothetical protein VM840_06190, partial [Actinomycetota bacterium]|nr:hypothetical protein [Actinomycetota bacterium]
LQRDADQDTVQVRITLEGSGRAEVRAELFAPDGRSIHRVDRAVELDGVQEIDLSDLPVPEPGGYRLEVEVTAPGIRSSQSVTIKRG